MANPRYYVNDLLTFAEFPEGRDGEPNIFGGHAQNGQAREDALKRFAQGDKSVIVFTNADYNARRIQDPDLIHWDTHLYPRQK